MNKLTPFFLAVSLAATTNCFAAVTYLSCDLPALDEVPARHFDFALDEKAGTVSYYVAEANSTNHDPAVFTPSAVNFGFNTQFVKVERTISRIDLTYTEKTTVSDNTRQQVGRCAIVKKPSKAKF
ncbi:hypothetical protein ACTJLD_21635 [Burkholderia sp. 22088]|uniref:hypothetical protein n=1 Tax=Burkholderia sp. 22088 TaxID=3453871 RepID=UPI003F848275